MSVGEHPDLLVRRTTRADVPAIVALASESLGWAGDQRDHDFFLWKHFANPFGESPGWAAFDDERMVAFRTMMRWRFVRHGESIETVRAVDTATHPDHRGRGLFRRLTMQAVDELTAIGIDAVFNTPNDQSRPGYLKMGWRALGRPTIWVSPRSPISMVRMVRARTTAEKWSEELDLGRSPSGFVAAPPREGWATDRTEEYVRWRYGFEPLQYRFVDVRGGVAAVRLRLRGGLRELVVADWLSGERDAPVVRSLLRESSADYAIGIGGHGWRRAAVPLPRQGPMVTWRPLARQTTPGLSTMAFSLGDLELF